MVYTELEGGSDTGEGKKVRMHWLIGGKRRREERRENTEVVAGFLLRSAVPLVLKKLKGERIVKDTRTKSKMEGTF